MSYKGRIDELLRILASPNLPEIDLSLERMYGLLAALENPHLHLPPTIHVAGTNGKGSTLAFIKAVAQEAGMCVHRYTSPHLVYFNERIELAGNPVDDITLLHALERVHRCTLQHPVTFFEATTAAAMLCFAEHPADLLLLEVGLGGRLDATNVVPNPLVTIFTPIDYDHQDFLGNTLTKIAHEKAGILRPGCLSISAPQKEEVAQELHRVARQMGSEVQMTPQAWQFQNTTNGLEVTYEKKTLLLPMLGLQGKHQSINAATAVVACMMLQPTLGWDDNHIINGVAKTHWPARLQRLTYGPLVDAMPHAEIFLDGGHNPHAAKALAEWLAMRDGTCHAWIGMRHGKDAVHFMQKIAPYVASITTLPIEDCADAYTSHALSEIALQAMIERVSVTACRSLEEAARAHNCDENATILICGSLYLAGNILKNHG